MLETAGSVSFGHNVLFEGVLGLLGIGEAMVVLFDGASVISLVIGVKSGHTEQPCCSSWMFGVGGLELTDAGVGVGDESDKMSGNNEGMRTVGRGGQWGGVRDLRTWGVGAVKREAAVAINWGVESCKLAGGSLRAECGRALECRRGMVRAAYGRGAKSGNYRNWVQ
ncbi:hypothetical protein Tco_1123448 [Tanacetum coccineum]|uniref:Uncharacterized protein n=1 Tax=Tanacetum coccineum TaxID=301880 RepID=A0ABQ5J5Y3_9ASTR